MGYSLRPHQSDLVEAVMNGLDKSKGKPKPVLAQAPTAFGKSYCIAELAKLHSSALILSPSKEITEQNYEKLVKVGIPRRDIEICSASMNSHRIGRITLGTIGTVKRFAKPLEDVDVVIIDECLDGNCELLTNEGWISFKEAYQREDRDSLLVAQYNSDGCINFTKPSRWVKNCSLEKKILTSFHYGQEYVDIIMTKNHRQPTVWTDYKGNRCFRTFSAEKMPVSKTWLLTCGEVTDKCPPKPIDRLHIMVSADGYCEQRRNWYWHRLAFKKERKIKRCENILKLCKIDYKKSVNSRGDAIFTFRSDFDKGLHNINISSLMPNQARELCYEFLQWDACHQNEYYTTLEKNADTAQAIACIGGIKTSKLKYNNCYRVRFHKDKTQNLRGVAKKKEVEYSLPTYCVTVDSSYFVARKNGFVFITGNCQVSCPDNASSQYVSFLNELNTNRICGLSACLDGDTEVLTKKGFIKFKDLEGEDGVFAQWKFNGKEGSDIIFEKASIFRGYAEKVNVSKWEKEGTELIMTKNHTIPLWHYQPHNKKWLFKKEKSGHVKWHDTNRMFMSGCGVGLESILSAKERLYIAIQADGHYYNRYGEFQKRGDHKGKRKFSISVKRQDKKDRLKKILEESCVPNTVHEAPNGYLEGFVYLDENAKNLWECFKIENLSYTKAKQIIEEMSHWDGHCYDDDHYEYYSCEEKQAEFYQAVGTLAGFMNRATKTINGGNRKNSYKVYFSRRFTRTTSSLTKEKEIDWNDKIYCLKTQTGYFVARKNGRVFITGNTPWKNQIFKRQFELPRVFCRPLPLIHMDGGKKTRFGEWFWSGGVVYRCGIKELQEGHYLAPINYIVQKTDWSFVDEAAGKTDYNVEQLGQWTGVDENRKIFERALNWAAGNFERTIVFTPTIANSQYMCHLAELNGIKATTLDSSNDNKRSREKKLEAFRKGEINVIFNVGVLTTGYDLPSLDCVILTRPTKSLSLFTQMVGRSIRTDPNKPDKVAQVVDMSGNLARFGRVEDIRLEPIKAKSSKGWEYMRESILYKPLGCEKYKILDRVS